MRPWLVLLLLVPSCSRPNPLFLDGVAEATGDLSSGPATSLSPDTGDTSAASTTLTPVTTTSVETTSEGSTTSTTGTAGITGTTDTDDTAGTTDVQPLCAPFPGPRPPFDLNVSAVACDYVTMYYGKVDTQVQPAQVALCTDSTCELCGLGVPVDAEVAPLLEHGTCLTAVHEGVIALDDPEAPLGCKTTGFALYDGNGPYPLYVASSRVFDPPSFLVPELSLEVTRAPAAPCDCDADACCLDGQATFYQLKFGHEGAPVATLAQGDAALIGLDGAGYGLEVVRAHAKGYRSAVDQTCVDDPETDFVDWHMLRYALP